MEVLLGYFGPHDFVLRAFVPYDPCLHTSAEQVRILILYGDSIGEPSSKNLQFWDIDVNFLENINIDINKGILQNIDVDKILYQEFGISNRATR